MKTDRQTPQDKLSQRVLAVIPVLGHTQFSAREIGLALNADKYDVLFTLYLLKAAGIVERVDERSSSFADCWRMSFQGECRPYEVENTPAISRAWIA